jgi:hypothetical protein
MPTVRQLRVATAAGPILVSGTVPPRRRLNAMLRSREHLTPDEAEQLMTAAGKRGRYGHRRHAPHAGLPARPAGWSSWRSDGSRSISRPGFLHVTRL